MILTIIHARKDAVLKVPFQNSRMGYLQKIAMSSITCIIATSQVQFRVPIIIFNIGKREKRDHIGFRNTVRPNLACFLVWLLVSFKMQNTQGNGVYSAPGLLLSLNYLWTIMAYQEICDSTQANEADVGNLHFQLS